MCRLYVFGLLTFWLRFLLQRWRFESLQLFLSLIVGTYVDLKLTWLSFEMTIPSMLIKNVRTTVSCYLCLPS